jgi:hypothetical protein
MDGNALPSLPPSSVDFNAIHGALLAGEKKKTPVDAVAVIAAATTNPEPPAPEAPAANNKEA